MEMKEEIEMLSEMLDGYTDEERVEIISGIANVFCLHCGRRQPKKGESCKCCDE